MTIKTQKSLEDFVGNEVDRNYGNKNSPIYESKHPSLKNALKILGGGGGSVGLATYMGLMYNAAMNPNAIYGYGMTMQQAEASGVLYPTLAFVGVMGSLFVLGGAYLAKSGIKDVIGRYKAKKLRS